MEKSEAMESEIDWLEDSSLLNLGDYLFIDALAIDWSPNLGVLGAGAVKDFEFSLMFLNTFPKWWLRVFIIEFCGFGSLFLKMAMIFSSIIL